MSSKRHSDRDKEFDLKVVQSLKNNGIFNQLQSGVLSDLAVAIQSSEFESMKCYQTIKSDIDNEMSAQIVFEYLKRNNMVNTIRTIQAETNNALSPKPISNDIEANLHISQKTDVLKELIYKYLEKKDEIASHCHQLLINQIMDRYENLGKSEPEPQPVAAPKPKETKRSSENPAQAPSTPPASSPPRSTASKNKASTANINKESSSLDFDFDEDPTPKTQTVSKNPPKQQDDSSELQFEDFDEIPPKPTKNQTAPAPQKKPTNTESEFEDSFFDEEPPLTVSKGKNNADFFDVDNHEPPTRKPPKTDDFDDFDDMDFPDSLA